MIENECEYVSISVCVVCCDRVLLLKRNKQRKRRKKLTIHSFCLYLSLDLDRNKMPVKLKGIDKLSS